LLEPGETTTAAWGIQVTNGHPAEAR